MRLTSDNWRRRRKCKRFRKQQMHIEYVLFISTDPYWRRMVDLNNIFGVR